MQQRPENFLRLRPGRDGAPAWRERIAEQPCCEAQPQSVANSGVAASDNTTFTPGLVRHDGPGLVDDAQPVIKPRRLATRSVFITGALCFLAGAAAWHLVGFWAFVSGIVYNQEETKLAGSPAPATEKPENVALLAGGAVNPKQQKNAASTQKAQAVVETLADLLQCAEVRRATSGHATVKACRPLRSRLQHAPAERGNRELDSREAAERLATGWKTGVSAIETGSLPEQRNTRP